MKLLFGISFFSFLLLGKANAIPSNLLLAQALENKTSQANVLLGLSIQYDAAGQLKNLTKYCN